MSGRETGAVPNTLIGSARGWSATARELWALALLGWAGRDSLEPDGIGRYAEFSIRKLGSHRQRKIIAGAKPKGGAGWTSDHRGPNAVLME